MYNRCIIVNQWGDFLNLAERLRSFREACGFSQQQIADKLNIHRATYSYYELGRTEPSSDNLVRLSRIFNVTLNELLGVQEEHSFAGFRQTTYISPDEDDRLNRLVGTSRVGDLTTEEKKLILSYRTLTNDQRGNLIETMVMIGLKSEKEQDK